MFHIRRVGLCINAWRFSNPVWAALRRTKVRLSPSVQPPMNSCVFQFVVPFLITLSQDPVWGVRKACCEVFVEVAAACSPRFKETQLAPRFIKLLSDSSRWVCCAAFEQLGPFIATFADSARTGLEIRDGRLAYTAESSSSCSSLHHLPTSFSSQDIGSPSSTNDGTSAPTAKTRLFYDDHNGAHNSSEASTCNVIIDSDDNSNDNAPAASSVHNNTTSDNDTEDEYQFYKLPKDVCLPVSKEDFNYEVDEIDEVGRQCEQPHQSSQILSGDEHLLKEFYGLLDSWTLDQKGDVRGGAMSSSMIGALSAAAACSTEDDLSKLEFGEDADDDEAYLYDDKEGNNNVEVLGENGFNHHDSSSDSTEAYGGVESVATTADDDFSELKYWSSNFVNIDLRSYGHKSNSKSVEATNLSNAYMERRMNMFVDDAVVGDSIQMKAATPNNCQQEQNRVEGQWSMSNEMNGKNERANLCTSIASGNNKSLSTTKSRAIPLPSNEDGYACVEFDGSVMKEVKRHSRAEWSSASAATVTRLTAAISSASSTGYNSENSAPIYMHAHCNSNQNDNCNGLSKSPVVNGEYNIASNGDVAAVDSTSSTPNEHSEQIVPKELLDSYVNRISGCANNEPDINRHCAHNFPAVAFTLGRRNWPQLLETYNLLAADLQVEENEFCVFELSWRVRQSLASSMHEVAAIIGEENADAHLVPVFEQFMKDVEDVRLGLLKHLYDFFKLVTPATRKKLLTVLASFLHSDRENERNWRSRHEYTRQCALLCDLYDVEDVNEYIAAIALTLATDRVADVRSEAAFLLAKVLAKFVKHEWNDDANLTSSANIEASRIPVTASFVNDIIKGFAYSKSWRRRQTFAIFCEKTLELGQLNYEQFRLLLLRDLLRLGNDVVPNIRLAFARTMCRCTATATEAASIEARDDVVKVLKEMMNDFDADCRRMARRALLLPDSENFIQVLLCSIRFRLIIKMQVKGREIIDSSAGPVTQATLIIDDNAMTMNDKFVIEQLEGAQGRAAVGCECGSESNSQLMQHQPASIYILEDETVNNSSSP
ncbi:unnamed protein product [Anisakis simplex]|uniref:Serine/threonine-protein phosphatase 4 regulatory subunit 1 n=1 Tax=Anisakis simplex TaxID=6269 RepID=A0A0M3JUJ1_ANISI|nr:unnamed protein product [Anisakis simplex]